MIYLLHYDRPLHHAQHYLGFTDDLDARSSHPGTFCARDFGKPSDLLCRRTRRTEVTESLLAMHDATGKTSVPRTLYCP